MNIAFLSHNVFSDGGVQRVITTVSNHLSEKHSVTIICTNTDIKINKEKYGLSNKVNIVYQNINQDNKLKISLIKFSRAINKFSGCFNNNLFCNVLERIYYPKRQRDELIKLISREKYDVIIGCEGYYSVLVSLINDSIKSKALAWQHNSYEAYFETKNKYYWNKDYLFKKNLKKADYNIVLTEHDRKMYEKKYHSKNNIVLNNPLSFRSDKKSNGEAKIILCAGRFTEQKGIDRLINAFGKIQDRKDWKLLLVGNGPLENELRNLVKRLDLEQEVIFKPFTNNIQQYMVQSSIYAMPSRWEGFGLVVIEALEIGLPVLAFDTSGPREILKDYGCGEIIRNNNIEEYSKALENLMENPTKRNRYSKNALKRAKDFYEDKIIFEWDTLLYKLNENQDL